MKLEWLNDYNLLAFEEIDSTNSEALRIASFGAIDDLVVTAKTQTGGKGSKGRAWISMVGNLHASILLASDIDIKKHSQLCFLAANALQNTLCLIAKAQNIELDIKLKWPNDVFIGKKKLAGILVESISFNKRNYVVIGIGVNILCSPTDTIVHATSLLAEGIVIASTEHFLHLFMTSFNKLYKQWTQERNFIKTRQEWMKHALYLNEIVTIEDGNMRVSGIFKDIDLEGAIRLQRAQGEALYNFRTGSLLLKE